jgi:predicted DNA-binding WGR domain protein
VHGFRVAHLYLILIEQDLFGSTPLVRNWGRIGTSGQELVEVFATEIEAGEALETIARVKRRRGYRDL